MTATACYWTAPTGRAAISLRRIYDPRPAAEHWETTLARPCPAHPAWSYHWASWRIAEVACELRPNPTFNNQMLWAYEWPEGDDGGYPWPTHCACGIAFPASLGHGEDRYIDREALYTGMPDAEPFADNDCPVGAVRRCGFYEEFALPATATDGPANSFRLGPDGMVISVQTPGGQWVIDQHADTGGFWTRTAIPADIAPGDRLTINASPSILAGVYHGWLRNGTLVTA